MKLQHDWLYEAVQGAGQVRT